MSPLFTETSLSPDVGFWPAVAEAVLRMPRGDGVPPADLRTIDVIVPSWSHAESLRGALHSQLSKLGHVRAIPPRIHTVASWAGDSRDETIERRLDLFSVLRANGWIRSVFGDQPAALWALAASVDRVCDELTFAAVDGVDAIEARLEVSITHHFHRRALRAVQPEAQLLLQLWRASNAKAGGARARIAALDARVRVATQPVVFVTQSPLARWVRAGLESLAARVPVHLIRADTAAAIETRPLLAAAWPELVGASVDAAPIAERARSIRASDLAVAPVLTEALSFEDQAIAVCEQVVEWLCPKGQGDLFSEQAPRSIALVALDRVAARRVRALLERAQILVRDETGWKLSTTSAAGAVMRLFDLGASGFHHRDLLDWLKSSFTLQGFAGKPFLVETIEKVIRSRGIVQGLGPIVRALHEAPLKRPEQPHARAIEWLRVLETHASRLAAGPAQLVEFVQTLDAALSDLGMRKALSADPVGTVVLEIVDDLHARASRASDTGQIRLSALEFRALLTARFEDEAVATGAVESPVKMVSLSATMLRDFDAAILIGADAAHLPALPPDAFFFSNAVRSDLGLPGLHESMREQHEQLAALLLRVPRVVAVWCGRDDDEPRVVAPWLARLRAVARAAGQDPLRPASLQTQQAAVQPGERPAPRAPARLGAELSATQYQSLVECPYQFYARHLLRLRKLDDVTDEPSASEYGKAVHEVLANFHLEWREKDIRGASREETQASLTEQANRVFEPLVERRPRMSGLRKQFAETQIEYLDWLRRRLDEGWMFQAAEVDLRTAFEVDATRTIDLKGRIDRIDECDGQIEVLDYKTRRQKQLWEDLAIAGENIQLPFYGLLYPGGATSASFVYLQRTSDRQDQVGTQPTRQPFPQLVEALRIRLRSDLKRIGEGATLPALGNEAVCEWCEMRGLCRRDFWRNGGK